MKLSKIFALLFGLAGVALVVASVWVGLHYRDASPMLLSPSNEAKKTVVSMLEEVCAGDYGSASQRILGNPSFGMNFHAESPAEEMAWEAFTESFSYELKDDCFATDSGLSMTAKISYLELQSITYSLRERTQLLMEQRIASAESVEDIYNENNEFQESFVMEALQDALGEAIKEDARMETVEFTVNLVWRDNKWWVVPDAALLSALSGGIA